MRWSGLSGRYLVGLLHLLTDVVMMLPSLNHLWFTSAFESLSTLYHSEIETDSLNSI